MESTVRALIGLGAILFFCWLMSDNRKHINWRLVGTGILFQGLLGLSILNVPIVSDALGGLASFFQSIMNFTSVGSRFLFGSLVADMDSFGFIMAFQVLPTIVFFSALSAALYHLGILQLIIRGAAWVMSRTMGLSGAESLAAAANVFIGQTEAPLVVAPYLPKMTRSELLCLMTGGMATIAGGVFVAYMSFLGGEDPQQQLYFAKHLLTASFMSAPAAIVVSKILSPEDPERDLNKSLTMTDQTSSNLLDAITRGTSEGLKLAVNVGAMLLVFIALTEMANAMLSGTIGTWTGLNEVVVAQTEGRFEGLTFTYLTGLVFAPVAWLIGVPAEDTTLIGQLLGQKFIINEFVAYSQFQSFRDAGVGLQSRSIIIATYALCGFANISSIGIQVGGISTIAPSQRSELAKLGMRSLIAGTLACLMTAALAGMFV